MNLAHASKHTALTVNVRDTNALLFSGSALAVSCSNDAGPFDVLALHTNFISVIKGPLTIIKENGEKIHLTLGHGVLKVASNMVEVYIGL